MATKNNSSRESNQGDVILLIEAISSALAKLLITGTSTIVVLGILRILAAIMLQTTSEMQQQILPLLTGILGVIIGRMLASQGMSPPQPPQTPSLPG